MSEKIQWSRVDDPNSFGPGKAERAGRIYLFHPAIARLAVRFLGWLGRVLR